MNPYTVFRARTGIHSFLIKHTALKSLKNEKRILCTIGDTTFHCALMKSKSGEYSVYIGQPLMKKLGLHVGSVVRPRFSKDKSEYQFVFPVEFREVLAGDPHAKRAFDRLTDGKKRGLIYLVERTKSIDKRIEKSLMIAEKLKNGITTPAQMLRKL